MAKKKASRKNTSSKTTIAPSYQLQQQPDWFTNIRLHCLIIFAFSFMLYANTLGHDYTQDDAIVIYDNEFTVKGIAGIPDILKYDTFRGFFKVEGKDQLVAGGRYRPLTLIMFAIEVQLFGTNPFIGHLINILLYGLIGIILYLLLLQLGISEGKKIRWWAKNKSQVFFLALATTLLFLAHPIHTEVVANIKGRDEIVTLLGSLAAVYFSLKAYYSKRPLLHLTVGTLFFLALLSKENAITFLAVVPLTYFFFTKAEIPTIAKQTAPFVIAAVLFLMIRTAIVDLSLGGEPTLELMNNPFVKVEAGKYVHFTGGEKFATIFYTLGKYVQLLIFPHPLTHDYYPRHVDIMTFGNFKVILSILFYLAITAYALIRLPKKDPISYGILFYLATISIASNIVFPIGTNMSERFAFMPSIGFCWIVSILLYRLAEWRNQQANLKQFSQLTLSLGIVGAIVLLFSIKTISRNTVWKDNYTLFTTDIQTSLNSAKLRNAAAGETIAKATNIQNTASKNQLLQTAEQHLKEAIKIHPNYKNAYLQLGNVSNYLQKFENAIDYYEKALELDPNYQDAINNMGITYRDAGRYYGEVKQNSQQAIKYLTKAYEMRPQEYETVRLLAIANAISGNTQQAISFFQKAVEIQPNNADALYNLGSAYYNAGNTEKGQEFHQKATQIDPEVIQRNQR